MRLINADSLKELYEGFGEYEDSLVVPIAVILQNIDDMPTIAMINESALGKPLKDERKHTYNDGMKVELRLSIVDEDEEQ